MKDTLPENASPVTLAAVLNWVKDAPLDPKVKHELRYAVKKACRWFGMSPDQVSADPVTLRKKFQNVSPGGVGVRGKTYSNVKSGLGRALDLMGIGSRRAHKSALSPDWDALVANVEPEYDRALVGRFGRFCCSRNIAPHEVGDAVADDLLSSLEQDLRVAKPRRVHRETVRLWNKWVASREDWPGAVLTLPNYLRKHVRNDLHEALVADIEGYLARQATSDPFDLPRPLPIDGGSTASPAVSY
jgi:hypothetical protein